MGREPSRRIGQSTDGAASSAGMFMSPILSTLEYRVPGMTMVEKLAAVLKIRPGEGSKVFQFALLGALVQAGLTIGMSAADSLFLINAGPENLPYIYIITPFIMLVYIPVYTYLMSRFGLERVFGYTLGLLIAGGVTFFLLFASTSHGGEGPTLIYYFVKLYTALWYLALYTLYWNFSDIFFDIQDAKRLYSMFSAGGFIGAIIGGGIVTWLTTFLAVEYLFLVWATFALLALPVVMRIRKRWKKIEEDLDEDVGFVEEVVESARTIRRSRFVLFFILALFSTLVLTTLNEFQYMKIFSEYGNEQQLASLFGTLSAVVNVFNVLISIFLFNRMVLGMGVRNVALIQPVTYLVVFTYFSLNNDLWAGILGYMAHYGILTAIEYNNENLMLNAIPAAVKKQVRTFIEGLCEPLSTASAGLFLLLWAPSLSPQQLSTIGLGGTVAYVILVFLLRSSYLPSMIANLKKEWLDFSRSEEIVLSGLDQEQIRDLIRRVGSGNRDEAHAALRILWLNDRQAAREALISYLSASSEEDRIAIKPLLSTMLDEEDSEVIRCLLEWLEDRELSDVSMLLEELGNHRLIQAQNVAALLHSSDPDARAAAVVASWYSWNTLDAQHALRVINAMLEGTMEERKAAIRALGRSRQERYAHFLAKYLDDPSQEIFQEAMAAIHRLVTRDSSRLIPSILGVVERADTDVRILAIDALTEIGDPNCIAPLLAMSESFTPYERRKAETAILTIGLQSVPTIISVLRDPSQFYKARSIAARALGKLAFPQLESLSPELIDTEIFRAYQFLYYHRVLESSTGSSVGLSVLSRFYRDVQVLIVDFVLEILTVGGRLPAFELISSALRSDNLKERANAMETIEQGMSREVFRRLLPLIDARSLEEKIRFYEQEYAMQEMTTGDIVTQALESAFALECSAAAQAIWDAASTGAADTLREKIHSIRFPLFRRTIMILFTRESLADNLTLIEILHFLACADFFESFATRDLEIIANIATLARFHEGEYLLRHGDPARTMYVIVSGEVVVSSGGHDHRFGVGDTVGEESVFGSIVYRHDVRAVGPVLALAMNAVSVVESARTYPRIAVRLLSEKLGQRIRRRSSLTLDDESEEIVEQNQTGGAA